MPSVFPCVSGPKPVQPRTRLAAAATQHGQSLDVVDTAGLENPAELALTAFCWWRADVFAATSPLLAEVGGVYLKDNDIAPLNDPGTAVTFGTEPIILPGVASHAVDPHSAQRLWDLSERLLTG
jgi:hypothetical protein